MNQKNEMGTKKMLPLILSMAIPPMISMFIQSLYNIVDSIFVAKLSTEALNAVSIIYPLQNLTLSIAVGTGVGLNSYIARSLGAGNRKNASKACRLGFILSAVHYALLALLISLFMPAFIGYFTDSASIQKYCLSYGYIVIVFCFGQIFHITVEKLFQSTGQMKIPMILQAVGCIVNIILDPVLIFGVGNIPAMGVTGAAIATVIGQMCSCFLGLFLFCRHMAGGKGEFSWKNEADASPAKEILLEIYQITVPSTLIMALPSILVSGLNSILSSFSSLAVSVFGIYYKLQTFVYMPTTGLVQGIRPIISYNYGAKQYDRQKEAVRISLLIVGSIMLIGTILFWSCPSLILSAFDADVEMTAMGVPALRIISIGFLPSAVSVIGSAVFESMGFGGKSLFITLLRQLIILLPLAYILSEIMGLHGIWASFPVAEIMSCILAGVMLRKQHS